MNLIFIRIFFVLASLVVGHQIGGFFSEVESASVIYGAVGGVVAALIVILFEIGSRKTSVRGLSGAVFGLLFGVIMAKLLTDAIVLIPMSEVLASYLRVIFTLIFSYLGMVIAMKGRDEFNIIIPYVKFTRQDQAEQLIVLDTSVIIDGRIADICQTKFLDGRFILPRFVLNELQQIADSRDSMKRNRGRRGLEILNRIQKNTDIDVRIHDEDFPDIEEVDSKLVRLAKVLNAKLLTNDFNLQKIAELQAVKAININKLAEALRPVVLPGEFLTIKLVKEGKEYNQTVGYLDDGTMVVVDNSRHLIGKTLNVAVTSVLQTAAGRMIFAKLESSSSAPRGQNYRR